MSNVYTNKSNKFINVLPPVSEHELSTVLLSTATSDIKICHVL